MRPRARTRIASAPRPTRSWSGRAPRSTTIPPLTVRDPSYRGRPPLRVVVDASGRVPADARVFDGSAPTLDRHHRSRRPSGGRRVGGRRRRRRVASIRTRRAASASPTSWRIWGSATCKGCCWRAERRSHGASSANGLIDRVVLYLAPKLVGGAQAPGGLMGEGFAPIGRAVGAPHRERGTDRGRPEGGGGCSRGSLRSGASCSKPARPGSWSAAGPSSTDSDIGASVAVNGVCLTVVARGAGDLCVRPVAGDARSIDPRQAQLPAIR